MAVLCTCLVVWSVLSIIPVVCVIWAPHVGERKIETREDLNNILQEFVGGQIVFLKDGQRCLLEILGFEVPEEDNLSVATIRYAWIAADTGPLGLYQKIPGQASRGQMDIGVTDLWLHWYGGPKILSVQDLVFRRPDHPEHQKYILEP